MDWALEQTEVSRWLSRQEREQASHKHTAGCRSPASHRRHCSSHTHTHLRSWTTLVDDERLSATCGKFQCANDMLWRKDTNIDIHSNSTSSSPEAKTKRATSSPRRRIIRQVLHHHLEVARINRQRALRMLHPPHRPRISSTRGTSLCQAQMDRRSPIQELQCLAHLRTQMANRAQIHSRRDSLARLAL